MEYRSYTIYSTQWKTPIWWKRWQGYSQKSQNRSLWSQQYISVILTYIIAPEFKYVSKEAIDLLKKMLTYDPERRISAEEAMMHPWIVKKSHEDVDSDAILNALTNLKNFNVEKKLQ